MENIRLQHYEHVIENVVLSTCNRTEVYAVVDDVDGGIQSVMQFMSACFAVPVEQVAALIQVNKEEKAIQHILRVICGMDSMVLGETEILGQMRKAFLHAQEAGTTGTLFNSLFKQAISLAKKVHHVLGINTHPISISYLAFQLSKKRLPDFISKKIVIVGAGTMGNQILQHVLSVGARDVTLVNRTVKHAQELAERHGVCGRGLESLQEELLVADVVFFASGTSDNLLKKREMEKIQMQRNYRELSLIDLGVPRNVDAKVTDVSNVHVYDMDDLQESLEQNKLIRSEAVTEIEVMKMEAYEQFVKWRESLVVVPILQALQSKKEGIQQSICTSIVRKIPELTASEQKIMEKHIASTLNQMIKEPIATLKQMSLQPDPEENLQLFAEIFGLDDETYDKKEEVNCEHSLLVREKVN